LLGPLVLVTDLSALLGLPTVTRLVLSGLLSSQLLSLRPASLLSVGLGLFCDITLWWVLACLLVALLSGLLVPSLVVLPGLLPVLRPLKTVLGLASVLHAPLSLALAGVTLWLTRRNLPLLTTLALWLVLAALGGLAPV
jgi:hypothetical protein